MKVTLRSAYLCLLFCSSGLLAQSWYPDNDSDGFGDSSADAVFSIESIPGYVLNSTDCNDTNNLVNPGSIEILYNGIDDNCDGQLDEGNQLESQVAANQCGTTLATLASSIYTTCLPQVTAYRFEVINTKTNAIQYLERGVHYLSLTMLPSYDYATTYAIRVELQRNGIWLGYYGNTCLISSPAVLAPSGAAQLVPSQCGSTLSSINSLIATSSLPAVTGYRFRITNISDPDSVNRVQTIDRALQWFSLPMLESYNYGTTYQIEVAVKTTGDYSDFGSVCEISSPAAPTLINCGEYVPESNSIIAAQSLTRATVYRFELTNLDTYITTTVDRPLNWFRFNNIPDYVPSASYGVRISVMTSGSFSPFGDACEIYAPGASKLAQLRKELPETAITIFPNPFSNEVTVVANGFAHDAILAVYDLTGRLLEKKVIKADVSEIRLGSDYPSGVYSLVLDDGDKIQTRRVIKR